MIVVESSAEVSWRKSKYSTGNGECVEVVVDQGTLAVRDSKQPDGPLLRYPADIWRSFLGDAKRGAFDVPRLLSHFW